MTVGRTTHPALLAAAVILTSGCGQKAKTPELGTLYNRAAQGRDVDRNPVIVIPGVLGSRLEQSGTGVVVWGAFSGKFANPEKAGGARLVAVPMAEGVPLKDLRDDVVPAGVLDDIHVSLLGLPIGLSAYRNILTSLGVGGYRDQALGESGSVDYGDEHFTCFQFDYDWRRDNVENAARLHDFIEAKKEYIADEYFKRYGVKNARIRFDIVAHSMGGLVARYYLRYGNADLPDDGPVPEPTWAGAENVARVIMVGTPNAGSALAVRQLVEDTKFAPIIPAYPAAVLGTMPAVYQLLPRDRHGAVVDRSTRRPVTGLFETRRWAKRQWGLLSPEQDDVLRWLLPDAADADERRRIARDHVEKCLVRADRFHAALDSPDAPPEGVELHLFAGDAEPTMTVIRVDEATGTVAGDAWGPGDGTVPRSSALLDERLDGDWTTRLRTPIHWTGVHFLFTDHLGLTKDPAFTDNVLYLLLEAPESGPARRSRGSRETARRDA